MFFNGLCLLPGVQYPGDPVLSPQVSSALEYLQQLRISQMRILNLPLSLHIYFLYLEPGIPTDSLAPSSGWSFPPTL